MLQDQASELQTLTQVAQLYVFPPGETPVPDSLCWESVPGAYVEVKKAPGAKCVRCWFTSPTVGEDEAHPQVCARCRQVLGR